MLIEVQETDLYGRFLLHPTAQEATAVRPPQ